MLLREVKGADQRSFTLLLRTAVVVLFLYSTVLYTTRTSDGCYLRKGGCVRVCVCVYLCVWLSVCICLYVSVWLCLAVYVYLSIYLSVCLSVFLSLFLSPPLCRSLFSSRMYLTCQPISYCCRCCSTTYMIPLLRTLTTNKLTAPSTGPPHA